MATIFHRARQRASRQLCATANEHPRHSATCTWALRGIDTSSVNSKHATRSYSLDAPWLGQSITREGRDEQSDRATARKTPVTRHHLDSSNAREKQDGSTGYHPAPLNRRTLLGYEYAAKLEQALGSRDGGLAMRCMASAIEVENMTWIRSINDAEFTDMLHLIQPQSLFGEQVELLVENKSYMTHKLRLAPVIHTVAEYVRILGSVVRLRRDSKTAISLPQYALLLKACAYLHHRGLAQAVWAALSDDGHDPDLACFNGYLGAVIWEVPIEPRQGKSERALVSTLVERKNKQVAKWLDWFRAGAGGVFETIQKLMEDMTSRGISPDVDTWCVFIRAASLEGRLDAISSSLQSVWGIDVAQIAEGRDSVPFDMATEDPLYPTTQLLFDVVRAYCINSDIFTAFKLIDSITRHYSINVSQRTWEYLLEWAYILSRHTRGYQHEQRGLKIASNVVMSLWQTISAPPFNVKASFAMANSLMKCVFLSNDTSRMLMPMSSMRETYKTETHRRKVATWEALKYLRAAPGTTPAQLSKALSEWESASLREIADRTFLSTWLWYVLRSCESASRMDLTGELTTVTLPRMLVDWGWFAGNVVTYCIPTGMVELELRDAEIIQKIAEKVKAKTAFEEFVINDIRDGINLVWQSPSIQSSYAQVLAAERELSAMNSGASPPWQNRSSC